jgi:hypothetical protein
MMTAPSWENGSTYEEDNVMKDTGNPNGAQPVSTCRFEPCGLVA